MNRLCIRGAPRAFALGLLVIWGCRRAPPEAPRAAPAAAVVNGVPIPLAQVQEELDRLRRGEPIDGAREKPVAEGDARALSHAVLDALIQRTVIAQRAKAAGVKVSEAEVQRATEALAESVRSSGQTFQQRLAADGETSDQLSEQMRDRLLAEKYVAAETARERASPAEARAWFDTHHAEFDTPETVHCQALTTRTAEAAKSALDRLRKGAAFGEVAREVGVTPDAQAGGDLGFFARGTMPKAFDEACFGLKPGALSGVVQSPYGFHVFKLLARRPAQHRRFEDVKAAAELRATGEKRAEAERQLLSQLRGSAQVTVDEAALGLLR